jgi:hypothetical protein
MTPLGRLTVHSSMIIAQEPCKICLSAVAILLGTQNFRDPLRFFKNLYPA